jgi:hypothetical protein
MTWWGRQLKRYFDGGVHVSSPSDDDLLQYNSTTGNWEASAPSPSFDISSPAEDEILQYNATSGNWENAKFDCIRDWAALSGTSTLNNNTSTYAASGLKINLEGVGANDIVLIDFFCMTSHSQVDGFTQAKLYKDGSPWTLELTAQSSTAATNGFREELSQSFFSHALLGDVELEMYFRQSGGGVAYVDNRWLGALILRQD